MTRSKTSAFSSSTCIDKEEQAVPVITIKTIKNDESPLNDETEQEETKEKDQAPSFDVLTVSMALTKSASYLQKCQLYCYLYKTIHNQVG